MIVTTDNKIMITTYVISCFVIVSPPFGDEPNSRQLGLLVQYNKNDFTQIAIYDSLWRKYDYSNFRSFN